MLRKTQQKYSKYYVSLINIEVILILIEVSIDHLKVFCADPLLLTLYRVLKINIESQMFLNI